MEMNNQITFCSYNMNHYDDVKDAHKDEEPSALETLFENCTFLILQETWLTEDEFIRKFKNHFPDSECIAASKMEFNDIRRGRPYGGVSICYHSKIKCNVEIISTTSKNICAQKIILDNFSILLINVYMPCSDNRDTLNEYSTILQEISNICIINETNLLVIGGDWNADPSRNDGRARLFKEFIYNEGLLNALDLDLADVPYTYDNFRQKNVPHVTSTIDHFLISPNLKDSIISYNTMSLANNFSDHIPIMLTLKTEIEFHDTINRRFKPHVAWHKCSNANIDDYRNELDRLLPHNNLLNEALSCKNYKCTSHTDYIQSLYKEIIKCCHDASEKYLPHTSLHNDKSNKIIPGWNEHVKEHAERAKLWHHIWKEKSCPTQGDIAAIRRKTRLKYHYAIRYVKKEQIRMRNISMGNAVANNNDRELWKEVKKIYGTNNKLPNAMDGHTDADEISDIFAEKYKSLYNSVGYHSHELDRLIKDIEQRIDIDCPISSSHAHTITVHEVKEAARSLKSGKMEENCLYSNHFKAGSDRLFVILTLLFNCMLVHGIAPDDLLLGTMIPLIKNPRGNKQSSDNYRSLTIGTGLSKLLDLIIIKQQSDALNTSELQFGFKEKSSTSMCTFMVLETIEYYRSKGSNVHVLLLDASKAFDRVNYIKLFDKLLRKEMCPLTVRLLMNMYISQKLQVKWNDRLSDKFDVTNGVRQGGILSPLLFSIYVDDLLVELKNRDIGCHMGHHFVGALGYADDLILLSPTVYGMKIMIKICEEYANDHCILFNGNKSKYLIFGKYKTKYKYDPVIELNNEIVPRCKTALHLGHLLDTENTNVSLVEDAIKKFNVSAHCLMSRFSNCNGTTKNKLFHQYCSAMYGSQLWDLTSVSVKKMCTRWRVAHRQILSLPFNTHSDILPLIVDNKPMDCMLDCRYLAFYKSIAKSENSIIRFTAQYRLYADKSTMGRNMTHLMDKYDISLDNVISYTKAKINKHCYSKWLTGVPDDYYTHAGIIQEMLMMKEERCTRMFSNDDCNFVIDFLCTLPLNLTDDVV